MFLLKIKNTQKTFYNHDLNKSTQSHDAFIGHVRQRHEYTSYWLAAEKPGWSSARLVLNTCISMRPFTLELANWTPVQSSSVHVL